MSEPKTTRRELLRPLHLLGIALACAVFAAVVTMIATGGFTAKVEDSVAKGTYHAIPPLTLALIVGGGIFIVTLLILAMLILAVDPAQVTKTMDRPVLISKDEERAQRAAPAAEQAPTSTGAEAPADGPDSDGSADAR